MPTMELLSVMAMAGMQAWPMMFSMKDAQRTSRTSAAGPEDEASWDDVSGESSGVAHGADNDNEGEPHAPPHRHWGAHYVWVRAHGG